MVRGTSSADRIDGWRDRTGPATITRTQGSLVVSGKTKPFPLWNEGEEKTSSPSFLALIMDGVEAASRVCDERRCAAPLTPLPPRWGLVSLDNANVVIDRMTEIGDIPRALAFPTGSPAELPARVRKQVTENVRLYSFSCRKCF